MVVVGEDHIEEVTGVGLEVGEVTAPTERVEGKPYYFSNGGQFPHGYSQRQSAWFLINKKTGVRRSLFQVTCAPTTLPHSSM